MILTTADEVRSYWATGGLPWGTAPSPGSLRRIALKTPEIHLSRGGSLVITRQRPEVKMDITNIHGVPLPDLRSWSRLEEAMHMCDLAEQITDENGNPLDFSAIHHPLCQPASRAKWSGWRSSDGKGLVKTLRSVSTSYRIDVLVEMFAQEIEDSL